MFLNVNRGLYSQSFLRKLIAMQINFVEILYFTQRIQKVINAYLHQNVSVMSVIPKNNTSWHKNKNLKQ